MNGSREEHGECSHAVICRVSRLKSWKITVKKKTLRDQLMNHFSPSALPPSACTNKHTFIDSFIPRGHFNLVKTG